MSRYVVAPLARSDLDEIWSYITANSLVAADRTLDRFHELSKMLARQPLIGESHDGFRAHLRSFPAGIYVIFYMPIESGVRIFRVLHGARDLFQLI